MITVIIPVLNEQQTIGKVVRYCLSQPKVSEVLVVDDQSTDNSAAEATLAGARVITSNTVGKGISMKDGIHAASNEILIFLDGDIDPYPSDTIRLLSEPILNNDCDFVKATFTRNAGRVTELMAKPLLSIFFPELTIFTQPLSGMIAGRKHLFQKIDFFYDYGVDIGILIDMFTINARMREVSIGYILNKSKPWHALAKMSKEVAAAIVAKAMRRQPMIIKPQQPAATS